MQIGQQPPRKGPIQRSRKKAIALGVLYDGARFVSVMKVEIMTPKKRTPFRVRVVLPSSRYYHMPHFPNFSFILFVTENFVTRESSRQC